MSDRDVDFAAPPGEAINEHEEPSARIPHLGHALMFFAFAGLLLLVLQAILLLPKMPSGSSPMEIGLQHPKLLLAAESTTYVVTLTAAWFVFPLIWKRSFLAGIDWNAAAAHRLLWQLIPLGLCTGWAVQGLSRLISMPKTVPMDDFFRTQSDVWLVTVFGTLLAPLFEEVCFRGFLLPSFAIACDWLGPVLASSLRRVQGAPPLAKLVTYQVTHAVGKGNMAARSTAAVVLASLVTSGIFGWMHAQQLGYAWPAVLLLGGVSLVLTAVRLRTRSVACSTLVHASYNFSVFLLLFVGTGGYRHLERMTR